MGREVKDLPDRMRKRGGGAMVECGKWFVEEGPSRKVQRRARPPKRRCDYHGARAKGRERVAGE